MDEKSIILNLCGHVSCSAPIMKDTATGSISKQIPRSAPVITALAVLTGICAIDNRSLWIDESHTAMLAAEESFVSFSRVLLRKGESTSQMPLHMLYSWGWRKLVGRSEYCLRLSNLPWFLIGVGAILLCWPRRDAQFMIAATLANSFIWYYLNEFRPYIMQWAGTCMAVGALLKQIQAHEGDMPAENSAWNWLLWIGLIVLCGSSLLGALWGAGVFLAWITITLRQPLLRGDKRHWPLGAAIIVLTAMGGYYCATLLLGARASSVARTGVEEICFSLYEILGLSGLGPGRLDLRALRWAAFTNTQYWTQLIPVAVGIAAIMIHAAVAILPRVKIRLLLFWGSLILPCFFLIIAGKLMHFRVLGRHFAPLVLFVSVLIAAGMRSLWESKRTLRKACACVMVAGLVYSCLQIRCAPRHFKDDYRKAARIAQTAKKAGMVVWWAADVESALYYGIRFNEAMGMNTGRVLLMSNATTETIKSASASHIVILSKKDIYDRHALLDKYLRDNKSKLIESFSAFTIWRARRTPAETIFRDQKRSGRIGFTPVNSRHKVGSLRHSHAGGLRNQGLVYA